MIIISTYNPESKRTTQDEELLTSLLASLIAYRRICHAFEHAVDEPSQKSYYKSQVENTDILIGSTFPLLGLSLTEVLDMVNREKT